MSARPDFDIDRLIETAVNPVDDGSDGADAALIQAWVSERIAPEILPYDQTLVDITNRKIRKQIETLEETEIRDAKTNFKLVIIQTELERVKYLMRSYLRTRIHKIDKYALHCLRDQDVMLRLSNLEKQYVQKHQAILERHYHLAFLKDLPEAGNLRKLDDTAAAGLSMIDVPDLNKAVFCKVVKPIFSEIKVGSETMDLEVGNTLLIRYGAVRKYIYDESMVLF